MEVFARMGFYYFLNWAVYQVSLVTHIVGLETLFLKKREVLIIKVFASASSEPSYPKLCVRPCFIKHKKMKI
jgi:hypothetical protein